MSRDCARSRNATFLDFHMSEGHRASHETVQIVQIFILSEGHRASQETVHEHGTLLSGSAEIYHTHETLLGGSDFHFVRRTPSKS